MKILIIFIFSALFLQVASFVLWFVKMRPYLGENGLRTLKGINYGVTIFNDVQQVIEVSKEKEQWPTFLTIFFLMEGTSIALFALGLAISGR